MAISTAAAIIGGSVATVLLGASSAKKSAKAQAKGQEAGIAEQQRQFDITQEQAAPFREAGLRALEKQEVLLGLRGAEAQQQGFNVLAESPGQRFLQDRARRNLERSATARGGRLGGNVLSALTEQGVGFAQQDLQNEIARLGQVAGQGRAVTQTLGQQRGSTATKIQQGLNLAGQSRASGIAGVNEAIQSGISGVTTGLATQGFFDTQPSAVLPASNIDPFARTA